MDFLAPFHPQIIHTPIVLLIVGLLFEIAGRVIRQDWLRKAAFVMLALGVVGAVAAVLSGGPAGDAAEHQGVPGSPVDAHEQAAQLTMYLAIAALVARVVAAVLRPGRAIVGTVALVLWLAAAVAVGVAGHRGGGLVFKYGAAVQQLPTPHAAPGQPEPEAKPDKD